MARSLLDVLKRDDVAQRVGISLGQAAGALALAYERLHKNLLYEPFLQKQMPEEIAHLCAIFVEWAERQQ